MALCLSSKDSLLVCSRLGSLSPSPRSAGRFSLISPQSLELDTGVNHHSLDLLFYRSSPHLISRCILRIPTPPSPQYVLLYIRKKSFGPHLDQSYKFKFKSRFIVIPLHVGTYSGTKCRASQVHGAT